MIISLKNLISIALKWKKMAGIVGDRRTISLPRNDRLANKGHFVVYSVDKNRFVVPLAYLHTNVFRELLRMSEEEFGLPRDGPIVLPCEAAFLEDVIVCIVKRQVICNTNNDHKALLVSLVSSSSSSKCSSVAASNSSEDQILMISSSSPITVRQVLMQPFD
ncbi:hypothetical protein Ddye_007382 [Dipteronia dyeriana]|uniref:Small auxin up regulated protein n=1 Tax=Dipteronia dyeriana TaxID=168575 RepID=A0AAE0CRM3_9ROSI|nr:hypothetical protein Ddye_007382 [Dipteronia dyeriana]